MRGNKKLELIQVVQDAVFAGRFEDITASKLAALAGLSKATLFHHYASLDELILESFKTAYQDIEEQLTSGPLTFADLQNQFLSILSQPASCEKSVQFFLFATHRAVANQDFAKMFRSELAHLCQNLATRLQKAGDAETIEQAEAVVLAVFAVFDGLAIYWTFAPKRLQKSCVESFVFIMDAIKKRSH